MVNRRFFRLAWMPRGWHDECTASGMLHSRAHGWWLIGGLSVLALACTGSIEGSVPTSGSGSGPPGVTAGGGAVDPSSTTSMSCNLPERRIWKLTPAQLEATLAKLVTLPSVATRLRGTLSGAFGGFSNEAARLEMSTPHVATLFEVAREAGAATLAPGGAFDACRNSASPADCAPGLIADLGARAFRRALSNEELARYQSFFAKELAASDAATALSQVLRALVLSPHFQYRTELGTKGAGDFELAGFERAQILSYSLTDAPPDAELTSTAAEGHLGTYDELKGQASRLLATRSSAPGLTRFFDEHFLLSTVKDVAKRDVTLYPGFSPDLMRDLSSESEAFVAEVLWGNVDGKAKLATLLTGGFSMLNERLASLYGIQGVTGLELRRTALAPGERAGLLTQGSFLARLASEAEGDVVKRGRFIREHLLCGAIPPPPANVNAVPPPPSGNVSQRERMVRHSADATCTSCHRLMDPLGFGFLNYDAIGGYRTQDVGKPIDASGTFPDATGGEQSYVGAVELSGLLASSSLAQGCFSKKLYRYVSGRAPEASDECVVTEAAEKFHASQGNILELAADLVARQALEKRREVLP